MDIVIQRKELELVEDLLGNHSKILDMIVGSIDASKRSEIKSLIREVDDFRTKILQLKNGIAVTGNIIIELPK